MLGVGGGAGAGAAPWSYDYRRVLLEEVALEGLEGISLRGLWSRAGHRLSCELNDRMKSQYWRFLLNSPSSIRFYELPEPALEVNIVDRFAYTNDYSALIDPPEHLDGPYTYCPVPGEFGSCKYFNERVEIPQAELCLINHEQALERWGDKLVAVASTDERWNVLAPNLPSTFRGKFKAPQYCILEIIGKGRENGQMTMSNSNLYKITKDPKTLFYFKKILRKLNLITAVDFVINSKERSSKSTLLRLSRFHLPKIMTMPKEGSVHTLITRLKSMPNQTESVESMQKYLNLDYEKMKKFIRRTDTLQFIKVKEIISPAGAKNKRGIQKLLQLDIKSDSSESEPEETEPAVKCQYKLGISLVRQAYQRILESGQEGLTQLQLAKLLDLNYSRSNLLLRILQTKRTIRHITVDRGRQRVGRYIAMGATNQSSTKYLQEKEKLLEYLNNPPTGKSKLSNNPKEECVDTNQDPKAFEETCKMFSGIHNAITEVRQFDNIKDYISFSEWLESNAKPPTLRQIQFTNAIIKIVREQEIISGVQDLNVAVNKETGIDMMDGKSLRRILLRLIKDEQIRFYTMKWPQTNHHSVLICAPYINIEHPVLRTAYRDVCLRAFRSKIPTNPSKKAPTFESLEKDYTYPRYLRARKLHEFIFNCAYGEDSECVISHLGRGFMILVDVIPEMTIDLAIGHICTRNVEFKELASNSSILPIKVKDAPSNICKIILSIGNLIITVKRTLRVLATFGLIQLCSNACDTMLDDTVTNLNKYVFYVNRHAKVVDTRGKWPDPNKKLIVKRFQLDSMSDVNEFWTCVYNTSINTNVQSSGRNKNLPPIQLCAPEQVKELDNGDGVAGDGLGPCGYDSCYFLEIQRLWTTIGHSSAVSGFKRKLVDLHKFALRKVVPVKRRRKAKTEKKEGDNSSKSRKHFKTIKSVKTKKLFIGSESVVMRSRTSSSFKWTPLEDKVLLWSRIAKTIMSLNPVQGALQITNHVSKDIINRIAEPRTAQSCDSRAKSLVRDEECVRYKEKIITEIHRRPNLMQKYKDLFRRLRLKHSGQFSKYIKEGRLRMLEFIWAISKISTSATLNQNVPRVAETVEELYSRFVLNVNNDVIKYTYRTYDDIQMGLLREGILETMITLMGVEPSMDSSLMIYSIFKDYPEVALRNALVDVRKLGAVSVRDKTQTVRIKKLATLSSKEVVSYSSSHKISAAYLRRLQNYNTPNFADAIADTLENLTPCDDLKSGADVTCVILELISTGDVELCLTKNPVVLTLGGLTEPDMALADVDEKVSVSLQRGQTGWRMRNENITRLKELYDNIAIENETLSFCSKTVYMPPTDCKTTRDQDVIIEILNQCAEIGATFDELLETSLFTTERLQDNLKMLEARNVIRVVGHYDNRIVLHKYLDVWSLQIEDKRVFPSPFFSFTGKMSTPIFAGWCSTILHKVIDFPGSSITKLTDLLDFLTPRNVEDVCNFLSSLDCVRMMRLTISEPGLFADDEREIELNELQSYYSPEKILVFPAQDSLVRFAWVRRKIIESQL